MFDFVFESKRGKRERNAARASAISRERTRFPCVETAFARVFFFGGAGFVFSRA